MTLRAEDPADRDAIHAVHASAFPTDAEARLVDRLRSAGRCAISLVAEIDGRIVGHVLFTPVAVGGAVGGLGLAPVGVLPEHQRRGIGAALVRAGLDTCRRRDCPFVVVLGEPAYYRRFGFQRAADHGLDNEYGAGEAFMVIELRSGGIPAGGGLVKYAGEFAALDA